MRSQGGCCSRRDGLSFNEASGRGGCARPRARQFLVGSSVLSRASCRRVFYGFTFSFYSVLARPARQTMAASRRVLESQRRVAEGVRERSSLRRPWLRDRTFRKRTLVNDLSIRPVVTRVVAPRTRDPARTRPARRPAGTGHGTALGSG